MVIYTVDDIHYNSRGVLQVSDVEEFRDLESTMAAIDSELRNGSELEQKMLSFFQREVEPLVAYKDNDVDQRTSGPKALHAVGKLKKIKDDIGLFVRIGISSPDDSPLIPVLQALYLQAGKHIKYMEGMPVGIESDPDRWFYDFTERHGGMVKDVKVRTRLGVMSLSVIPAINEAILSDSRRLELPLYK